MKSVIESGLESLCMKLGDGRKVTMHVPPDCEERSRLAAEAWRLRAEWLESVDELKIASKRDSSYEKKVEENKSAKRNLDAAWSKYSQHVHEHGCR